MDAAVENPYERFYCHGARVALGWVLGIINDPGLLTPIRDGDGAPIPDEDREVYRAHLRAIAPIPAVGCSASERDHGARTG